MHELALIQEVCALAQRAAQEQGARTIHRLELRIGSLGGVDPEALRQAFAVVSASDPWRQTQLALEVVPTRCFCADCRQAFTPVDVIHACPHCGQLASQVIAGRELELVALEVS